MEYPATPQRIAIECIEHREHDAAQQRHAERRECLDDPLSVMGTPQGTTRKSETEATNSQLVGQRKQQRGER